MIVVEVYDTYIVLLNQGLNTLVKLIKHDFFNSELFHLNMLRIRGSI